MADLIDTLAATLPKALADVTRLGHSLKRRTQDILADFEWPRTSNGPTEAMNGLIDNPRGNALGFGNPTNHTTRASPTPVASKPEYTPYSDEPD
jgi:transposase